MFLRNRSPARAVMAVDKAPASARVISVKVEEMGV